MNFRILMSVIPVAVFLAMNRAGFPPAATILAGFGATTFVFWYNRRDRLIGALTAFGFVVLAISAVIGIIWASEKAYLASGPVSDLLFVPVYLGSIVIRQPLIGGISRELVPAIAWRLPPNAPVFVWLTVVWAIFNLFQGIVRWYLLETLTVSEYIIWSRVVSLPISGVLVAISGYFIYRAARRHALAHKLEAKPVPA